MCSAVPCTPIDLWWYCRRPNGCCLTEERVQQEMYTYCLLNCKFRNLNCKRYFKLQGPYQFSMLAHSYLAQTPYIICDWQFWHGYYNVDSVSSPLCQRRDVTQSLFQTLELRVWCPVLGPCTKSMMSLSLCIELVLLLMLHSYTRHRYCFWLYLPSC